MMQTIRVDQAFQGFSNEDRKAISTSARIFAERDSSKLPTCTMQGETFPIIAVQTKRKNGRQLHRVQRAGCKMTEIVAPAVIRWRASRGLPPRLDANVKPVTATSAEDLRARTNVAISRLEQANGLIEIALQEVWGIEALEDATSEAAWAHFKAAEALTLLRSSQPIGP